MESTESVSKGCFAFNPKSGGSRKTHSKAPDPLDIFGDKPWYCLYTKIWRKIEKKLESLGDDVTESLLSDIVNYIVTSQVKSEQIPTATLLTGINLPDHGSLFRRLSEQLSANVTPHIALLRATECPSLRHCVQQTVGQLMKYSTTKHQTVKTLWEEEDDELDSEDECESTRKMKRGELTMPNLLDWYSKLNCPSPRKRQKSETAEKRLVIILSEFEAFSANVLKDFMLLLSGYSRKLPIVIVIGVATTVSALANSLPHRVTSRLAVQLFQSQPSVYFLNNTLEKVFLTSDCPFQLGPKVFKFLTDVFLFYDFSVYGFTQGIKYCVMDHFYNRPVSLLCCKDSDLEKTVGRLKADEVEDLRKLWSFRGYVEAQPKPAQVALLTSDSHLKKVVVKCIRDLKQKIFQFHVSLRLLKILVSELPNSPLGKQVRELYYLAISGELIDSSAYKECIQLLGFQAKDELLAKLDKMVVYLKELEENDWVTEVETCLTSMRDRVETAGVNKLTKSPTKSPRKVDLNVKNRAQLREKLAQMGKMEKQETDYEAGRRLVLNYLMGDLFPVSLASIAKVVFSEVMVCDSLTSVKRHVVGQPRASLHTALNNPKHYLQCDCCSLDHPTEIRGSMPDICIAYKLHLESGTLINMYDWLVAFATIVDPESVMDEKKNLNPKLQARFSQAVAELEFLGFIKSSKRKTDHVARLTWGGNSLE